MLDNYNKDKNGVVFQVKRGTIIYDDTYVKDRYLKAPVAEMAHLRLGYLLGALDKIPQNVIDIGYGSGDFLKAATKIIPACYGSDIPPAYPVEGVEILDSIYGRKFAVACFFDSLEHFDDIYEIENLQTDYIYISVPWCHYSSDEWFENWKHRRADEHYWHFNLESLTNFMDYIDFERMCYSNVEDTIRKNVTGEKNILTAIFKKKP